MLEGIGSVVALLGGVIGLIGGVAGLVARYRPPKLDVAYTDYLGVVVSQDRTTWKLHLPLVVSNMSSKPGVITHLRIRMTPEGETTDCHFDWGLFWRESPGGARSPERRPIPVPVPAMSTAEKSIQFESRQRVSFSSRVYRFDLEIRAGRRRSSTRLSTFFMRPSEARCRAWYTGQPLDGPKVDIVPIYPQADQVPEAGD